METSLEQALGASSNLSRSALQGQLFGTQREPGPPRSSPASPVVASDPNDPVPASLSTQNNKEQHKLDGLQGHLRHLVSLLDASSHGQQHDVTNHSLTSGNGQAWKAQQGLGRKGWDLEKGGEIWTMLQTGRARQGQREGQEFPSAVSLCSILKVSTRENSRPSPESSPSSFL